MATIFRRRNSSFSLFPFLRLLSASSYGSGASKHSSFSKNRDERSPAYRQTLQCRPPATIKRHKIASCNSVSLIGTVRTPIRRLGPLDGDFCVWSLLESKPTSRESPSPFMILLQMWDEMANIALQHLRPNDSVYVSGYLSSYTKVDASGRSEIFYKVIVNELNYIKYNSQVQACKNAVKRDCKETKPSSDLSNSENERVRLHLWQVFFANPHEWWDNRKEKGSRRFPDFRHKDTRECLSLRPDDPPWVRKQLELLDSKTEEQWRMDLSNRQSRHVSMWEYDEQAWAN